MRIVDTLVENSKLMGVAILSTLGIDIKAIMQALTENDTHIFMSDTVLKPLIAFVFVKILDYTIGKKIVVFFDKIKAIFK